MAVVCQAEAVIAGAAVVAGDVHALVHAARVVFPLTLINIWGGERWESCRAARLLPAMGAAPHLQCLCHPAGNGPWGLLLCLFQQVVSSIITCSTPPDPTKTSLGAGPPSDPVSYSFSLVQSAGNLLGIPGVLAEQPVSMAKPCSAWSALIPLLFVLGPS